VGEERQHVGMPLVLLTCQPFCCHNLYYYAIYIVLHTDHSIGMNLDAAYWLLAIYGCQ
jgi:hypothetical protein